METLTHGMKPSNIKTVQDYMNYLYENGMVDILDTSLNHKSVKEIHTLVNNTYHKIKHDAQLFEIRLSLMRHLEEAIRMIYGGIE